MAKDTPWMAWLKKRVRRPRWARCDKGGSHSASLYAALNAPIDLDRFGEYRFHCTAGCHRAPENPLSDDQKHALYAQFLEVRREGLAEKRSERAQARADTKAVMEAAGLKPAPRPRKKKTADDPNGIVSAQKPPRNPSVNKQGAAPTAVARAKKTATTKTPAALHAQTRGKCETAADQHDSEPTKTRKGKGKAKADPEPAALAPGVENDEYDSETYEIDDDQRRSLQLIVYTDSGMQPIEHELNLRAVSHFDFNAFNIAKVVGAVSESESGLPFTAYEWYCVIQDKWFSVASPINLQPRGKFLVCRKASLADGNCPGILIWVELALRSALAQFGLEDSDDDVSDGEYELNYELEPDSDSEPGPSSSLPTAPPASPSVKFSPVKSSPSRKRKAGTSGSVFLEEQTRLLEKEDQDDEGESPAKRHKSGKAKEVIVVTD